MSNPESIHSKIETVYAFTKVMNDEILEKFNNQTFTQESAFLKINYFNPKILIVQHVPIRERVKKFIINRMRNGYIVDTLTSVDINEVVTIRGRVTRTY